MEVGARLGTERLFQYLQKFGVLEKTGIDLSGEAATIMHQKKNVGAVELATMTFGQSFQLTPLRLLTSVSAVINGGRLVTPHVGVCMAALSGMLYKLYQKNLRRFFQQFSIPATQIPADVCPSFPSLPS